MKECHESNDHRHKDNNIVWSNANLDLCIGDMSNFMDSTDEDDSTSHHTLVTPDHKE